MNVADDSDTSGGNDGSTFDAWTPCFDDIWEKRARYGTWTGTVERPPVPHRVELDRDFHLGEG